MYPITQVSAADRIYREIHLDAQFATIAATTIGVSLSSALSDATSTVAALAIRRALDGSLRPLRPRQETKL